MSTPTRPSPGVLAAASDWGAAAAAYLRARMGLFGIEAKDAGLRVGIALALGVGALFVVILGYVLFVFFAIFGIAELFGGGNSWIWVTLGAALLHFALAGACVWIALKKFKDPMFPDSLDQLRKDQAWLKQKNNG